MRGFKGLLAEASEREYWAEDDHRWGLNSTAWHGFWLLAFVGRIREFFVGRKMLPMKTLFLDKDGKVTGVSLTYDDGTVEYQCA